MIGHFQKKARKVDIYIYIHIYIYIYTYIYSMPGDCINMNLTKH